ncbi:MAG: hypothetical protein FWE13_05335 [Firmicutes bacterium]|nr:hypothetical protein [Bacillota bacterium]
MTFKMTTIWINGDFTEVCIPRHGEQVIIAIYNKTMLFLYRSFSENTAYDFSSVTNDYVRLRG